MQRWFFSTGLLARELGGGRFAQVLAAISMMFTPAALAMSSFLSMNAFEPVLWTLGAIVVARLLNGGSPRLWLLFGLVSGIGLLNKHTMLVFGFGIVVGLLLTGRTREFGGKWIWLGAAIASVIFLPNLIWEARNHWPQIEVVHNDRAFKTNAISPLQYLWEEVLFIGPVTLLVGLAGLIWYFAGKQGKRYRVLGYAFLCALVIFATMHGKAYYLVPAYAIIFAAGGIALEPILWPQGKRWRGCAYFATLILAGLATLPFCIPVLPVDLFARYQRLLPLTQQVRTEHDSTSELPQLYADMFGWPEMTATIANVYNSLPLAERLDCAILAGNYGEAGAIDQYGAKFGLPKAISPQNSYFFWGPRDYTGGCVILFGENAEAIKQYFGDVQEVATLSNRYAMPNEEGVPVYLCRRPRMPLAQIWPHLRFYL